MPPHPDPLPARGAGDHAACALPWTLRALAPGVALSAAVAVAAVASAPLVARAAPIPAMVIALIIGIALSRLAEKPCSATGSCSA